MIRINLTEEELNKLKVISDFLFADEYADKCSFPQFEIHVSWIFTQNPISLDSVFRDLCGEKRKYLTFKRLIKSYLTYKNTPGKLSKDTKIFFSTLLKQVLKEAEDTIEVPTLKAKIFTSASNKNRSFISQLAIITDQDDVIRGLKLEYDDLIKSNLYNEKETDPLQIKIKFELEALDEDSDLYQNLAAKNEYILRDSITHVFGTFSNHIELFGFKTRRGETYYTGNPQGTPFLFGANGQQLHYMKIKEKKGIVSFTPFFINTPRSNSYLSVNLKEINQKYLYDDVLIYEEKAIDQIKDSNMIQKYLLSAPIYNEENLVSSSGNQKLRSRKPNALKNLCNREERRVNKDDKEKTKKQAEAQSIANALSLNDILAGNIEHEFSVGSRSVTKLRSAKKPTVQKENKSKSAAKKEPDSYKELISKGSKNKNHVNVLLFSDNKKGKFKKKNPKEGNGNGVKLRSKRKAPSEKWNGVSIKNENISRFLGNKENFKMLKDKINNNIKNEFKREQGKISSEKNKNFYDKYLENHKEFEARKQSPPRIKNLKQLEKKYDNMKDMQHMKKTQKERQINPQKRSDQVLRSKIGNKQVYYASNGKGSLYNDFFMDDFFGGDDDFENFSGFYNYKNNDAYFGFGNLDNDWVKIYNKNSAKKEPKNEIKKEGKSKKRIVKQTKGYNDYGEYYEEEIEEEYEEDEPKPTKKYVKEEYETPGKKQKESSFFDIFSFKEKEEYDPEADKRAKKNWKHLAEALSKNQGLNILQTIGAIIKACVLLQHIEDGDINEKMPLAEQMRLYQLLEDNENIIEFLSQPRPTVSTAEEEEEEIIEEPEEDEEDDFDYDEIKNLSLEELSARIKRMEDLSKGVQNKEQLKKLNKIKQAYIEQKHKLLEEEERKMKEEMMKKENINVKEMENDEKEKRMNSILEKNEFLSGLLDQLAIDDDNSKGDRKKRREEKKKKQEERRKKREKEKGIIPVKPNEEEGDISSRRRDKRNKGEEQIPNKPEKKGFLSGETFIDKKTKEQILSAKPDPRHAYREQKITGINSSNFKDPLFPADIETLCPTDKNGFILPPEAYPEDVDGWENFSWARAHEILGTQNYKVFDVDSDDEDTPIEDDDIIQGSIGNCYFLSAIAALSKHPVYIEKLFYTKNKSDTGAYGVYYLINGEWKLIVLDDYFPCSGKYTKRFAFSSANGKEIWVMLLEKAWAKIHGNYARIGCGGQPHEVFDTITEAYSERVVVSQPKLVKGKVSDDDPLWNKLINAQNKNFIMTCGTGGNDENEEYGLVSGHAYTIINVWDLFPGTSKHLRLLNIRNPWGNGEWTGDWSDSSDLWTKEIQKLVTNLDEKDDGEFFMSYEDFCKFYAVCGICHFGINYKYSTRKIAKHKEKSGEMENIPGRNIDRTCDLNKPVLTKVQVLDNNVDAYFRIIQKNPRFVLENGDYPETVLEYVMLLDENFNYMLSESDSETSTCIRYSNLKKGTYYLVTDINYRYILPENKTHGYVISAYSNGTINLLSAKDVKTDIFEIVRNASAQLIKGVYEGKFREGEIDKTIDEIPTGTSKQPDSVSGGRVLVYSSQGFSHRVPYQIFHFENNSSGNASVDMNINCRGTKAFCFYCTEDASEKDTSMTLNIPANGSNTLLVMRYSNKTSFSASYSISCSGGYNGGSSQKGKGSKPSKKTEDDDDIDDSTAPVFDEVPQPLDDEGNVNQYYMEERNGYILGIENNSKRDLSFKLVLTGLTITDAEYKGKSSVLFNLKKGTKRAFTVTYIPRYNGGLSFVFQHQN